VDRACDGSTEGNRDEADFGMSVRSRGFALCLLAAFIVVTVLGACSSSGGGGDEQVTPAGLDGNEMYGQADMQWVLDNISVFRTRTDLISPDRDAASYLNDLRQPITIMVFMGSWSVDAQIHVPSLFATMQEVDNDRITLRIIGLNRYFEDRDGLATRFEITASPTFVIMHRNIELGRIIEAPSTNPAADIVTILRTGLGG
jgi:hypothetical protein